VGPLVLGATGRVGCALRTSGVMADALWQSRAPRDGFLTWDMLHDPAPELECSGVIQLAGGADSYAALAAVACDLGDALDVPVLIASTQAVYGPQAGALSEDTPCQPTSDYGRAKRAMEQAVAGRDATCLRIGNVAGCDALFRSMTAGPVVLDEISAGQGPRRAMIGPVTLAHVLLGLLETETPPVLNVAQPGLVDMGDLLRAADATWDWQAAPETALAALELDLTALTGCVSVPVADPAALVAEARATGWVCA